MDKKPADKVFCKKCGEQVLGPHDKYSHLYKNVQNPVRGAQTPGGKCKCGQSYDLNDSGSYWLTKDGSKPEPEKVIPPTEDPKPEVTEAAPEVTSESTDEGEKVSQTDGEEADTNDF